MSGLLIAALIFFIFGGSAQYDEHESAQLFALAVTSTVSSLRGSEEMSKNRNPLLSVEPLKYSLHPDWKLWSEMEGSEQQQALDRVGNYLKKYGDMIGHKKKIKKHGTCDLINIGLNIEGDHNLCGPAPPKPCNFISFGINDDPSFDRILADRWGCRGFAGDPTVEHPSKLHPLVTFHNVGATLLMNNEEREVDKGGAEDWWLVSMPKMRFFLGLKHINIIKLDCEGCEVAFARDILREDPSYLHHVDQLSIETHVTRTWLDSREHVYYFGLHFALLEEAGFVLEWSNVFGCSKRHEVTGCMPELEQYGFPCGYKPWPAHPNVVIGVSCQDFLWKRYPEKASGSFSITKSL
jgi:hypothetical protein